MSSIQMTTIIIRILLSLAIFFWYSAFASASHLTVISAFNINDILGGVPIGPVISDGLGDYYGVTHNGGANGYGVIFEVTPTKTLDLYDLTGSDGRYPVKLIKAGNGRYYGITHDGDDVSTFGTAFEYQPATDKFTVLHTFLNAAKGDGAYPDELIDGKDGYLYGLTPIGGAYQQGTLYSINLATSQYSVLWNFNGTYDGGFPGVLERASSTSLIYGMTAQGGSLNLGTFFSYDGVHVKTLHSFYTTNTDIVRGPNVLTQGSDGFLYGASVGGGVYYNGNIFRFTPNGDYQDIHDFAPTEGASPTGLYEYQPGLFLGATSYGGAYRYGTIFEIRSNGGFGTLYSFTGGTDGSEPYGPLVEDKLGRLYGVTAIGGPNGGGEVYQFSVSGPDFNEDGQADLLFQNSLSGQLAVWYLDGSGANTIGGSYIVPTQSAKWQAVGIGDFNGDGQPDVLFQNSSSGQLAVWLMNGTTAIGGTLLSPIPSVGWRVVAANDFDNDGQPDLLFQNQNTGQLAIWLMDGTVAKDGVLLQPMPLTGFRVVGTGDFNGDGQPDILFQNMNTGQLAVWFMNGTSVTGGAYIEPSQSPNWLCVSVIDLNGDSQPDLVFQNRSTGQLAAWLMNGTAAIEGQVFPTIPLPDWIVIGPR